LLVVAVVFLIASKFTTPIYDNYTAHPMLFLLILITVLALLGVKLFLSMKNYWTAWLSSSVRSSGNLFGFVGLFPNMLPSSLNPAFSLTAYNASSSHLTLQIMFTLAAIFVPVVLAYQIWVYSLFRHKVSKEELGYDEAY